MSLYLVLPLLACIATSILATIVCCRGPRDRSSRDAALLLGSVSFWAACEVLSNSRSDPVLAFAYIKASALGWAFIGPLGVGLALAATGEAAPRIRRALPALIATGALFLLLDWFTPWFHTGVVSTRWGGWGYELGPAFAFFHLYMLGCMWLAFAVGRQAYRRMNTERERCHARWVGGGLLGSITLSGLTDGLLPMFGVQVPHLGTIVHASSGGVIAWTFYRSGYPLLAPGLFAGEILETLPDGVAMLRLDGRIRYGNSAMGKLLGHPTSHVEGLDIRKLILGLRGRLIDELTERFPEDTIINKVRVPIARAAIALQEQDPQRAINLLESAIPYQRGRLWAIYLRGLAYLAASEPTKAMAEFLKLQDLGSVQPDLPVHTLTHLGMARASSAMSNSKAARESYDAFLERLKDADDGIPLVTEARAELARLP